MSLKMAKVIDRANSQPSHSYSTPKSLPIFRIPTGEDEGF